MPHIFGPRNETISLSWYPDFTSGLENLEICLKLYRILSFCLKILFTIGGDKFLPIGNNLIVRDWHIQIISQQLDRELIDGICL